MINVAETWNVPEEQSPVRNLNLDYLKFINTSYFSEEARRFMENKKKSRDNKGYYVDPRAPKHEQNRYWDEQLRRIREGYEVGGVRITGRHYFYLNFSQILAVPINPKTGLERKDTGRIETFPRFLDHNYYFFHELEKNLVEGPYAKLSDDYKEEHGIRKTGMIIAKSRRKGMTYAIANGVFSYNYHFVPYSYNTIAAYESGQYKVTMDAILKSMYHLARNKTPFAQPKLKTQSNPPYVKSGFLEKSEITGDYYEDGLLSVVEAMSFKDNPYKSIGHASTIIGFEEAGRFIGLKKAYNMAEATFRSGNSWTGVPLLWGTSGDMEKGSVDFADMFYNPHEYGLASYENIYDENAEGECGYFIDDFWYKPGFYKGENGVDAQGNSRRDVAKKMWEHEISKKKKGTEDYDDFLTQYPPNPSTAFLQTSGNIFDVVRASNRIAYMKTHKKEVDKSFIVDLVFDKDGNVKASTSEKEPIRAFPHKTNKHPGAIEIWEKPQKDRNDRVFSGRYIAGIDSYDQDQTSGKGSLGSCFIFDLWTDRIVAEYTGRPQRAMHFFENVRRLLIYYNARGNYENRNRGIYQHFYSMKSLAYLVDLPKILSDKGIVKARPVGNAKKGTPPSEEVNRNARLFIDNWSRELAYGYTTDDIEEGAQRSETTNMDIIPSVPLLQEITMWNSEGNFDRISALGMCMILRADSAVVTESKNDNTKGHEEDEFFKNIWRQNGLM